MGEHTAKPDRRKTRTRRLLRDALMALILEKGYDAVSVQEIADRANLGRATFYLHYAGGKDHLLSSSLEEIYDDLVQRIKLPTREELIAGQHSPSLIAFQHAAENRDLYRVLLAGQGAAAVSRRIRDYLASVIQKQIEQLDTEPEARTEVMAQYMAGALVALIAWWLEKDMPYPAETMSQIFSRLSLAGVMTMMSDDTLFGAANESGQRSI